MAWLRENRTALLLLVIGAIISALVAWLAGLFGTLFGDDSDTRQPAISQVATTPKPRVEINLAASRFNPQDGRNAALEYVCLVNKSADEIDLQGWVLRDRVQEVNVLPEHVLPPGGHVRVHPGRGQDSATNLYGDTRALWNNDGDKVTLLDRTGQTIDVQDYGARPKPDGTAPCS